MVGGQESVSAVGRSGAVVLADLVGAAEGGDAVASEMYLPGAKIKLSKTPARVGPVPAPGQDDEVLGRLLAYGRATLDSLRHARAIA